MKRRQFLKGASLLAAAAGGATLLGSRIAGAFGEIPPGAEDAAVPKEQRAESILEIFLYGGVSQYESFYCVDKFGQSDNTGWWCFQSQVQQAVQSCGIQGPLLQDFATDSAGNLVKLGPFVMPLRKRPDVVDRMRVAITAHDLEPHEGAIPLALAGRPLGHPALAGLGSHIQRFWLDHGGEPGRAPYSYVLLSQSLGIPTDNISSATAIGMHPGAARPLGIKVDAASDLTDLLGRGTLGQNRDAYDQLMAGYIDRYQKRLTWKGNALRAPRLADLAAATGSIKNADAIAAVLDPKLFSIVGGNECGEGNGVDATAMSLNMAAHLITHPTTPAKYVCVIDGGLVSADGGGGYDSHAENSHTQARNMSHMLKSLMNVINQPGEGNPNKLDLDKTMIVLTTEFGRTPYAQDPEGRNHWPYGYPIVFLGGPIRGAGKGVFGATGPDAVALAGASSPQENRIAALLALGIWPFASESYNVSDVPGAMDEKHAATLVKQRQLGLT